MIRDKESRIGMLRNLLFSAAGFACLKIMSSASIFNQFLRDLLVEDFFYLQNLVIQQTKMSGECNGLMKSLSHFPHEPDFLLGTLIAISYL